MAKREEIITAAARMFAKHGYHGTQLEQIARSLGLSKGALYWYFPKGKEQLFVEACKYTVERALERMKEVMHIDDPLERIRSGLHLFFQFCKKNRHFVELIIHERGLVSKEPQLARLRDEHIGMLVETLEEARKRNLLRPDVDTRTVARAIASGVFGVLFLYIEGEIDLEKVAEPMAEFLFWGVMNRRRRTHKGSRK